MLILKKIILCSVLIFGASQITLAVDSPVAELQSLLKPISSMRAKFTQTVFNNQNKVMQNSSGNMEFQKPSSFRWQIEQPEPNLIITDGKKIWNYDVELEQVTVQKFNASKEISPISFLFKDLEALSKDFMIVKINDPNSLCRKHAENCFKLAPKQDNSSFLAVELGFTKGQLMLMRLFDHLGQTSVFNFTQVQNNTKIANARFTFIPPEGIDVIGEI